MMTLILSGGPVMWAIAVVGLAATGIFFVRFFDLRSAHVAYVDFMAGVENLLAKKNDREALAICDETPAPVARVAAAAIRHRESSARVLREAVDTTGRAEVSRLERRLAMLAIIAQTAPLLGLLGTILGMARLAISFNSHVLVTRADLIGGALQCLTAAAGGLVVAVAVQVMYGMLHVRLERVVVDLEAAASEILALLASRREVAA